MTEAGERLASVACRIIERLDAAVAEISGQGLAGSVRIGIPDEHGKDYLASIISRFAREHPMVELAVYCALSSEFPSALAAGDLDLAIHEVAEVKPEMRFLREVPMHWASARSSGILDYDPLPVALFDRACWWREAAIRTLERSGRSFRIVFTSESMTGIAAAIEAGIAIGVLERSAITPSMTMLREADGFGKLPASNLVLETSPSADSAHCEAMAAAIESAFFNRLG